MAPRCPGQDMRYWKPDAIFDVVCPKCDFKIEFWKDEPMRICKQCGCEVRNPRIDLGCAKWCKFAKECLGSLAGAENVSNPVVDRLLFHVETRLNKNSENIKAIRDNIKCAESLLATRGGDPHIILPAVIFASCSASAAEMADIFAKVDVSSDVIEKIQRIVTAVLSKGVMEIIEFKIVSDVTGGTCQLKKLS